MGLDIWRKKRYLRSTDRMEIENESFDMDPFSLATTNIDICSEL